MQQKFIKLALGQMLVEGGEPAANLERAVAMIEEAARRGCQIVVLPECLDVGWTHPSAGNWRNRSRVPAPINSRQRRPATESWSSPA